MGKLFRERCYMVADYIKTGGKGYTLSQGDGLAYSYSVYNDHKLISDSCCEILILNTVGKSVNHYRQSPHVGLLGIKK